MLIGLLTQVTAFVIAVEMVVAYVRVHVPRGPWPLVNRGELAVVYCFLLFYMASVGGGPLSLDRVIATRRRAGHSTRGCSERRKRGLERHQTEPCGTYLERTRMSNGEDGRQ